MARLMTNKASKVLDYITSYQTQNEGVSPTFRDIMKGIGVRSLCTVHLHVNTLRKKGYIKTLGRRAIVVIKKDYDG